MTAQELLVFLQRTSGKVNSNRAHLQEAIELYKGTDNEWIIDRLEASIIGLPTDFQNSHFFNIIKNSFEVLIHTVKEEKISFNGNIIQPKGIPLFGTINLTEFNAFVHTEDKTPLIVFNNGLIMFTQRMIELYCKERWLLSKGLMNEMYSDKLIRYFLDIMICFHIFKMPYGAIPFDWSDMENFDDLDIPDKIAEYLDKANNVFSELDDDYLHFEHDVTTSTYLWMVSHEYSHLLLGHLNTKTSTKRMLLFDSDLTEHCFEWQQEYDADLLGAIITMRSESGFYLSAGIYLALACLQFSTIFTPHTEKSSHPPIDSRIKTIISHLESTEDYLNNFSNIDAVLVPKFRIFQKFLSHIDDENIIFTSPIEMQKYIYKEFNWK